MDWLDSHAGSVQAVATLVLVVLTGYYAWFSRMLARDTRITAQAAARNILQGRLDRIQEIFIREPGLFEGLDEAAGPPGTEDGRFHITSMLLGVMEEAFMQFTFEHSMTPDDWSAWQATAEAILPRRYIKDYWERAQLTFEPSFRRYVNEQVMTRDVSAAAPALSP